MIYREYGRTGKNVSILGAGGMRYADPAKLDEMALIPLEAARLGVNYFDTAPYYCDDNSENILSLALAQMRHENLPYYVSTKCGEADGSALRQSIERSLERLKIDKITFMHCWCVTSLADFENREKLGAIKTLLQAKEEGLVEHVVVSTHMSSEEIATVLARGYFEGMTIGFNAANFPYREGAIADAAARNMGVAIMNPLGGGEIMEYPDRFDFIRTRQDQSLLEAALHFVMGHAGVSTALCGFRSIDDVRSAVAAAESFVPLSETEFQTIKLRLGEGFNTLCTTCNYCSGCPRGIPVVKFMEAYNKFIFAKDPKETISRLKWHWDIENASLLDACIGCEVCEQKCTQHLPILERFDEIQAMFKDAVVAAEAEGVAL